MTPIERHEATGANPKAGTELDRLAPRLVVLVAIVVGGGFLLAEQQWNISTYEVFQLSLDEAEAAVGSLERKLGYSLIFGLGLVLAVLPSRQQIDRRSRVVWLALAYVVWCAASVLWSDQPTLTIKRVGIMLMVVAGIVGVTRHFAPSDLTIMSGLAAAFLVLAGVIVESAYGTFRPWLGYYRFAGTVHPNTQGAYCVVLCLAGWSAARGGTRGQGWWYGSGLLGAILLVLTKSRTCMLGCGCGLMLVCLVSTTSWRRVRAMALAGVVVAVAVLVGLMLGMDEERGWERAVMLGREDESTLESANGRVPLWTKSAYYAAQRPLVGYGYGAFWTTDRVSEVAEQVDWYAVNAHCVYLDLWLGVGLIGLILAVAGVGQGMLQIFRVCFRKPDPWNGFVLALMSFALTNSFLESGFAMPSGFDAFVAACGFLTLAGTVKSPGPESARSRERRSPFRNPRPAGAEIGGCHAD